MKLPVHEMLLQRLMTMLGIAPTCEGVNDFIVDYLEGALDDKTAKRFEMHIRACDNCARYLEDYRTTISVVRDAGTIDPPNELVEMTLAFLQQEWQKKNGKTGEGGTQIE